MEIFGGTHAKVIAAKVHASYERQHPGVRHRAYWSTAARRRRRRRRLVSPGTRQSRPRNGSR